MVDGWFEWNNKTRGKVGWLVGWLFDSLVLSWQEFNILLERVVCNIFILFLKKKSIFFVLIPLFFFVHILRLFNSQCKNYYENV